MFFLSDYCDDLGIVVGLAKNLIGLIRFGVPILLIIFGTLDLAKAVISSKEDEMEKAQRALIKRLIYAIAVFLVVTLVNFAIGLISTNEEWHDCWVNAKNEKIDGSE